MGHGHGHGNNPIYEGLHWAPVSPSFLNARFILSCSQKNPGSAQLYRQSFFFYLKGFFFWGKTDNSRT